MDIARLKAVVAAIGPGHWASYGDVNDAAGAHPRETLSVNRLLTNHAIDGAHRVLLSSGRVAGTALGDPDAVRAALAAEGIDVAGNGRAPAELRVRKDQLLERVPAPVETETPAPRTAEAVG